jgi:hypothetical protein
MLRQSLSFISLWLASTATQVVAQNPGSFADGGNTLVSALMVSVYSCLLQKNPLQLKISRSAVM